MTHTGTCCDKAIVLGGGAVGMLIARQLRTRMVHTLVYDSNAIPGTQQSDARCPDSELREQLRSANLVVLALPQRVLMDALGAVASLVQTSTLIVETASVKTPVRDLVRSLRLDVEVIGINPLFAPALGFCGQNVAVVSYKAGGYGAGVLKTLFLPEDVHITEVTADRHDQLAAITQSATHAALLAFGHVIAASESTLDELLSMATPPFDALLSLLARILSGSAEVYWDVQSDNPDATRVRKLLQEGLTACDRYVDQHAQHAFAKWLAEMDGKLGPVRSALNVRSSILLNSLERMKPSAPD